MWPRKPEPSALLLLSKRASGGRGAWAAMLYRAMWRHRSAVAEARQPEGHPALWHYTAMVRGANPMILGGSL